jgi:hypothetical protein
MKLRADRKKVVRGGVEKKALVSVPQVKSQVEASESPSA